MLHRTASSRRRRASRSAGSSSANSPQRGTLPSRATRDVTNTSARGRRASVAVGALDNRSPTGVPEDGNVTPSRSPRGSIGGDITPDANRSPRSSLVPETPRTSPRGSLAPEYNRSPRNSLVPDPNRSPRNSLIPDPNRSPRNSLIPDPNRSPRNSLVPDPNRSPRNSFVPDTNRSPRNSLVPDPNRSPRNSLVPDPTRSPRNSLVPDPNRSPRNSLVPDPNRSPRNSLVPDSSRSPRNSLVPDCNRSPRSSLVPDSARSPRNSLIPETFNRSPRGSLVPEGGGGRRSPRGSIGSAAGIVEAAFERGAGFMDTALAGPSRATGNLSPYRMSVFARGAQVNLGYSGGSTWSDVESRRASSNVSQVSADDRRHLCERTKLSADVGLSAYGSVVYQLKDANIEASGTCDFVCRALRIVYKTVVVTVALVCLTSLPLLMLIMGVQFLRDCPVEPHVPVYMLVGGSFGTLKMLWLLWRQVRSRRYERLDLATPVSNLDDGALTPSAGTRVVSAALSLFLVVWFALGNYWVLHIAWPEYKPTLFEPNRWCHKTLYMFALVHLVVIYSVLALMLIVTLSLLCCQLMGCPLFLRYK